jgi:glutamate-1-semialdehyde aminotransferase
MAVFAKSMSNGYAMSTILGKEQVMQAAQKTFISSTNWTDRIGPTAALATLKKYQREEVHKHIIKAGNKVQNFWKDSAAINNLKIKVTGLPSLAAFSFDSPKSIELNTCFTIEMLKEGFLGFRQFKPSLAHTDSILCDYENAVKRVFKILASDIDCNSLNTPMHHSGFKRLTKE